MRRIEVRRAPLPMMFKRNLHPTIAQGESAALTRPASVSDQTELGRSDDDLEGRLVVELFKAEAVTFDQNPGDRNARGGGHLGVPGGDREDRTERIGERGRGRGSAERVEVSEIAKAGNLRVRTEADEYGVDRDRGKGDDGHRDRLADRNRYTAVGRDETDEHTLWIGLGGVDGDCDLVGEDD